MSDSSVGLTEGVESGVVSGAVTPKKKSPTAYDVATTSGATDAATTSGATAGTTSGTEGGATVVAAQPVSWVTDAGVSGSTTGRRSPTSVGAQGADAAAAVGSAGAVHGNDDADNDVAVGSTGAVGAGGGAVDGDDDEGMSAYERYGAQKRALEDDYARRESEYDAQYRDEVDAERQAQESARSIIDRNLARIRLESDADRIRREKRERSRRIIAGVTDGLTALSNMYFTTQYAPDAYKRENSMSDAVAAGIERARKEREKNLDNYMKFSLQRDNLDLAGRGTLRAMASAHMQGKAQRQNAHNRQVDLLRKEAEMPYKSQLAEADARNRNALADRNEVRAAHAEELERAEIERKRRMGTGGGGKSGGTGGGKGYIDVRNPQGDVVRVLDSELNAYYGVCDPALKERYERHDRFGRLQNATKEQMRQVVEEHIRSYGDPLKGKKN